MIRAAETRQQIGEREELRVAGNAFRLTLDARPGDHNQATAALGGTVHDRNNNRLIDIPNTPGINNPYATSIALGCILAIRAGL